MCWSLENKVVVITGGAHGIGYSIADKYLQQSAKIIIILDINETHGVEAVEKLTTKYGDNKAVFIKCDVTTDVNDISTKIFSSHRVDVLVTSAGIINEITPKKCIDVNLTATIECSFKFFQHMRKDQGGNGGTIINMCSIYGIRTDPFFPTYQSTKHAVKAFTKSLGHIVNYERSGVRVIAICPGATATGIPSDLNVWDEALMPELIEFSKSLEWQETDVVGNAAVDVYQKANSGTLWKIENSEPVVEIIN